MFASSNHPVGTYNAVDDGPESMTLRDARPVEGDAPPTSVNDPSTLQIALVPGTVSVLLTLWSPPLNLQRVDKDWGS